MTDTHRELIENLHSRRAILNRIAIDLEYQDPFWIDRYGDRGLKFAREDGDYHLTYLIEALTAEDPEVLCHYARWLRSVLVSRGMCSRHLCENFRALAAAIREQGWPNAEPALSYLSSAEAALGYDSGPARELDVRRDEIVSQAKHDLSAASWTMSQLELDRHLRSLLSYMTDAVALDSAENLTEHLGWAKGFMQRLGHDDTVLLELIAALRAHVGVPARILLDKARAAPPKT